MTWPTEKPAAGVADAEPIERPTCRGCYAATLTPAERERFYAEPVTSCVYWCPEHQRAIDEALAGLPQLEFIRTTLATFEPPVFPRVEDEP